MRGLEGIDRVRTAYLVCNHQSYLDVLALAAVWPGAFVTSVEVQTSGFLGLVTRLGAVSSWSAGAASAFLPRRPRSLA